MTDDELIELHEKAIRDAMDAANKRDGFASSGSRESIVAGLRLVAERAWDEGYGSDEECHTPRRNPYHKEQENNNA